MGLFKTAARTAVITSTATRAHGRATARQQNKWAAQNPAPAPAPAPVVAAAPAPAAPPADTATMIAQLTQLGELKAAGVLTEVELKVQKARILQGG